MIDDRDFDLLKEAVSELARLNASALEEWAGRLGMDPLQLNKLVLAGDGIENPVHPANSTWRSDSASNRC